MVKHIVLWKLKDDPDKQQNIDRMIEMLKALVGQVEGLVSIEMGYNFNPASDYDVALYATLKTPAALRHYQNHPAHVKCKEFIGMVTVSRAAVDYFYDDEAVSAKPLAEVADIPEESATPATPEPEAAKEPYIWIDRPPKRVILPAIKPQPKATTLDFEDQTPIKPYVPGKAPEITVRKPPLWEAEVFPAETGTSVVTDTPVEAAPMTVDSVPAEPAPMKFEDVPEPAPMKFENVPEPAPMKFENVPEPAPMKFERVPKAAAPAKMPVNAQVNPVSTEHSTIKEKAGLFGKKKLDVEVTPLEQRSDTWTCPNCGKVMPNYVGTCGCGEPKPFEFEAPTPAENAPAAPMRAPAAPKVAPKAAAPAKMPVNAQVNPVSTEHSTIKEKAGLFGKKKLDVEVTPLEQRSDTWTCPNCGKVMPNYVGTCGCGEPKPFEFEAPVPSSAPTEAMPDIMPAEAPKSKLTPEQMASFENVQPSIQGYNPQIKSDIPTTQGNTYNYIQNDTVSTQTDPNYQAPDLSFIHNQDNTFNNDATNQAAEQDFTKPLDPFDFNNAPAPAPMRFDDTPPAPMRFDDLPPAAPMRFSDEPPAFMGIGSSKNAPAQKAAPQKEPPKVPEYQRAPVDDFASSNKKKEKKPWGKKAKEAEVLRKAQEAVDSRKDVPNDGTWTCPNCGKVMPKYVGTCGCGEPQPFEF